MKCMCRIRYNELENFSGRCKKNDLEGIRVDVFTVRSKAYPDYFHVVSAPVRCYIIYVISLFSNFFAASDRF